MTEEGRLPELRVVSSGDAVADAAADEIARSLAAAIAARGVAHVATTGGSSAPGVYRRLGRSPLREAVDWSRVHVWWGDDRFVPSDHPLSNVLPFTQILLASGGDEEGGSPEGADVGGAGAGVHIPADHIHEVPVTLAIAHSGGPAWAAASYAASLRAAGLPLSPDGDPVLDVIVLGVGPDGHVLSVFRDSPAWDATETVVGVPAPTHIEPHVARVTIHPRLVPLAGRVVLLTTGASKADVLARAWAGADVRELAVGVARTPQRRVDPRRGGRGRPPEAVALARAVPRCADAARGRARRHPDRGVRGGQRATAAARPRHDGRPPHLAGGRTGARHALAAAGDRPARPGRLGRRRRRSRPLLDRARVRRPGRGRGGPRRGDGRARGRRRPLAGRADRARGEPADAGHPAGRRVRGCAAATGRGGAGPRARGAPAGRPRGGRPRRDARAVHDRGHRHAGRRPRGVPRRPDLAASGGGGAHDPARARRRGA